MVAISVGPGGIKTKVLRRDVPITKGLEFGTERQEGNVSNLVIQKESLVDPEETVGMD